MLARFENARALNSGAYEFEDRFYRWVDFYDPESRETVIRFGVDKDVPEFTVIFGDVFDLTCEVMNETKVVRGTDRTAVKHKVVIHEIKASKVSTNGRAPRETVAAVA